MRIADARPRRVLLPFVLVILSTGPAPACAQTVSGGPGNDYQASVVVPWQQPQQRIAVFERLDGSFSGDLWLTHSSDGGSSWSAPEAVVASAANERHASLVQTAPDTLALFHLGNAGGGFRIHRALSVDGGSFVASGALDLGWASAGEVNPQVTRDPDGTLNLCYHRLGGAAYIARSADGGTTWDMLRTQLSPGNAALPRLTRRAADGRYLLVYQTGSNPVTIWTRTSLDPHLWTDTPQRLVADGNNHDGWPLVLPEGRFAVFWARVVAGAFQIHASVSDDGTTWSPPAPITERPGLANVQPFAFAAGRGRAELYWGAAQVAGSTDHDIVRAAPVVLDASIHEDGFEDAAAAVLVAPPGSATLRAPPTADVRAGAASG